MSSVLMLAALVSSQPNLQAAIDCSREQATHASLDRPHFVGIAKEAEGVCSKTYARVIDDSVAIIAAKNLADSKLARENIGAKLRLAAESELIRRLETGETFPVPTVGSLPPAVTTAYNAYGECFALSNVRVAERSYEGDVEFAAIVKSPRDQAATKIVAIGQSSCPQSRAQLQHQYLIYLASEKVEKSDEQLFLAKLLNELEQSAVTSLLGVVSEGREKK